MEKISSGTLLIAEPFLKDPNFMRSVVLLCEHNEEGSFGLRLNKKFDLRLGELITELEETNIPVFLGGPVQADTLHFLHNHPDKIPGGVEVTDNVYWGGDFEMVKEYLKKGVLNASDIRFYLGYSGWGSSQLDNELDSKSWITARAKSRIVFHATPDNIWKDSLALLGGDYSLMTNFPIDPQLN